MNGGKSPFGATGRFPEGKLHSSDEGELQFGVAEDRGNIIINFGKPVAWLGIPLDTAEELARVILDKVREARIRRLK